MIDMDQTIRTTVPWTSIIKKSITIIQSHPDPSGRHFGHACRSLSTRCNGSGTRDQIDRCSTAHAGRMVLQPQSNFLQRRCRLFCPCEVAEGWHPIPCSRACNSAWIKRARFSLRAGSPWPYKRPMAHKISKITSNSARPPVGP